MLTLLSPAKTQNLSRSFDIPVTKPLFEDAVNELIAYLRTLPVEELKEHMKVSDKIALSSFDAFRTFHDTTGTNGLALFSGDAFSTLDATTLDSATIDYAQSHLLILSGLYGVLRPLDEAKPYRLEMAYTFKKLPSLSIFWRERLTTFLRELVAQAGHSTIINLASSEYFKAIDLKDLEVPIITPQFKDQKEGKLKTVSVFAKRARGACARYILKNRVTTRTDLVSFSWNGYRYSSELSTEKELFFVRKQ